ncbi:hypothetical protein FJR38_04435 [Anabaena sp. UHCC 0253]|uniref:hypothetical protein n=1 Tax=Anabaena sp. UHCC 0253 TaxID=2590019 RepID=UPI00144759BA|nr:hypothetical protein [Anabaena sp. UHCC 0253]MTJ51972.1 hypothetical protein [Anabaena sp. UHCC 0253]
MFQNKTSNIKTYPRQQLWQLMVKKNTPLINKLLSQIGKHPEFETWRQKGKYPTYNVRMYSTKADDEI